MPTLGEKHYGLVTDNSDPEKRGRLKVRSQSLTGADYELPDWIEPSNPSFASSGGGGSLFLPKIGSTVELDVECHDTEYDQMPNERFLQNPNVKWRHATYTDHTGALPCPAALQTNYPDRRGFVTPAGHQLIFDDKGGITIKHKVGHTIELQDGRIIVTPVGKTTMVSPTELGDGATELMILGNLFMALFNAHVHNTGVGPSSPTPTPMTSTQLSQQGNKVK